MEEEKQEKFQISQSDPLDIFSLQDTYQQEAKDDFREFRNNSLLIF